MNSLVAVIDIELFKVISVEHFEPEKVEDTQISASIGEVFNLK